MVIDHNARMRGANEPRQLALASLDRDAAQTGLPLRELEVTRREVRGRYSGQRDRIVRVVGYDGVCSDLLGIGHRRRVIRKQSGIELQHVMRRIEVRDGVIAETRIEREGVLTLSDCPDVARRLLRREKLRSATPLPFLRTSPSSSQSSRFAISPSNAFLKTNRLWGRASETKSMVV